MLARYQHTAHGDAFMLGPIHGDVVRSTHGDMCMVGFVHRILEWWSPPRRCVGLAPLMGIYEWWVSPKETCVMGLGVLIQVWSMLDLDLNSNQGHNMFIHDGSRSGRIVLRIQIKDVNGPIWSGLMQVWSPSPSFNTLLCFWTGRKRCGDRASHLESEPSRPWHCAVPSRERLERAKVLRLLFSLIIV